MQTIDDGIRAFKQKDYSKTFVTLMPLAQTGHPEAQCIIGNIYHPGLGKKIDMDKAVQWYEAAAKQGYGVASNNLFELYRFGEGIEQDMEAADYWRERAIAQGFPYVRKQ